MSQQTPSEIIVRPRYGLPRFKRTASVAWKDGAIVATNRWGKARAFPLADSEDSPKHSGGYFDGDRNLWWLIDSNDQLLLLVDLEGWRPVDFNDIEDAAGDDFSQPVSDEIPQMRPDVFKVGDLPLLRWAFGCVAIGTVAMSLRWLHVLPEAVVVGVALPALLGTLWLMALLWIARPSSDEKAHAAYVLGHLDEISAAAEAGIDPEDFIASKGDSAAGPAGTRRPDQPDGA